MQESSLSSTSSPAFVICRLSNDGHSDQCEVIHTVVLTCVSLKLQYFGHLMWRVDSLEKTLMLGGIGGRRRIGWQRMRWLDGIIDSMDVSWVNSGSWWWTGRPGVLRFMGWQRVGHDWATELNWTECTPKHVEKLHFLLWNNKLDKIPIKLFKINDLSFKP